MRKILLIVALIFMVLAVYKVQAHEYKTSTPLISQPTPTPTVVAIPTCHNDNSYILTAINKERSKRGIPALSLESKLNTSAYNKNIDMKNNSYWEHVSPSGKQFYEFIHEVGYKDGAENLAMGYNCDEERIEAWMNSPKHAYNILDSRLDYIGIDRMTIEGKVSIVTHFSDR